MDSTEQTVQEQLVKFCELLRSCYRLLKTLTSTERATVDKTLAKASRYEQTLKCNPGAGTSQQQYTEQQIERIQTECLHEINQRLIGTGELMSQMVTEFYKLLKSYQELESASRKLDWSSTSSSSSLLIIGSERQKPLEFYLHEGFRITYQLNAVVNRFKLVFSTVDVRQAGSVQKFRDCLKLPDELDLGTQELLTYSVFVK